MTVTGAYSQVLAHGLWYLMQETNVVTWMHDSELYRYGHWKRTPNIPRHSK